MLIEMPSLRAEQIGTWIRESAEAAASALEVVETERQADVATPREIVFDFWKAREPLLRARAKTTVPLLKPIRRLRTNQEAINEGLIDSVAALISLNKTLVAEFAALSAEVAELRMQLQRRDSSSAKHV